MSDLEDIGWKEIIVPINDSINRIDLFLKQFQDRNWDDVTKAEFKEFAGHLEDAQKDLENFRKTHYYEGSDQ